MGRNRCIIGEWSKRVLLADRRRGAPVGVVARARSDLGSGAYPGA